MNNTQIEDSIYGWLHGLLGIDVIFAYPGQDRPKTPYALINFLTDLQDGTEESNGELIPVYSSVNVVTFSINTYYDGAFQKAIDIKTSLMRAEVDEYLFNAGLGYTTSTQIQKIPELIDKRWEERAQFDINFSVRRETEIENIGEIKKIEVNNDTIGES